MITLCTSSILPCVHFFRNDIGLFTYAAREQLRIFKNRRTNFVEVVRAEHVAHRGLHKVPQRRLRREKIASSSNGFDHRNKLSAVSYQLLAKTGAPCTCGYRS